MLLYVFENIGEPWGIFERFKGWFSCWNVLGDSSFASLTSTNRKQGTMELLLFTPGFSSTAIPLSVSVNVPLSSSLPPYPEGKRVSQVSPLANLRSSPKCEIKWNPIRTNELWVGLGLSFDGLFFSAAGLLFILFTTWFVWYLFIVYLYDTPMNI